MYDRLTLGAAEFFGKPSRCLVSTVHAAVELVDLFIEGISTNGYDGKQADYSHRAVFDFTSPQANSHYTSGEGAAGRTQE